MLTEYAQQVRARAWRRLAAGSLIFTGLAHLATEALAPATPARSAMIGVMQSWRVAFPGAERNMGELFFGFSIMMGVLLVGCGAMIASARPTRASYCVMVGLTLVAALIAWRYFFAIPGALTTLAALAAVQAWRAEPRTQG